MRDLKLSDFDFGDVIVGLSYVSDGKWVIRKERLTQRDQLIFSTRDSVKLFYKGAMVRELSDETMGSHFKPLEKLGLVATWTRVALRIGNRSVRLYLLKQDGALKSQVLGFDERLLSLCEWPMMLHGTAPENVWQEPTGCCAIMPYDISGSMQPEDWTAALALSEVDRG